MYKKILNIFIIVLICTSICGCNKNDTNNDSNKNLIPTYFEYDVNEFEDILKDLYQELEKKNTNKVLDLYDDLLNELKIVQDNYTIAYINSDIEIDNEQFNENVISAYEILIDLQDKFSTMLNALANSYMSEEFKKHLNNDYVFNSALQYKEKSQELKDLLAKENKLKEEYESLDYTAESFEEKAGEIFVELLPIRDKIAKLEGYDNYNEYCDKVEYLRDYSSNDLLAFYAAAKKFTVAYEDVYFEAYNALGDYDKDLSLFNDDLKKSINGISSLTDKAFDFLVDNNLYYYTDSFNSLYACYTTSFIKTNTPFIYLYDNNSLYTISSLVHEFGHFVNSYVDEQPYPIFDTGSYDLFEIHSTGLQVLSRNNLEKLFNDKNISIYMISDLIGYVMDGCFYDEWQRKIYENPDMTLDEINKWYYDLSLQYGRNPDDIYPYDWMYINHNFSSPLYYISYAASAYVSLQIFLLSLDDYAKACNKWEELVEIGAYDTGYLDTIKKVDFDSFMNLDAVLNTLNRAYDYCLNKIEENN